MHICVILKPLNKFILVEYSEEMSSNSNHVDVTFKLVLIGESSVGKTCIVLRYMANQFICSASTLGAALSRKILKLDDKTTIIFEIWDTAGQERFNSMTQMYYRGAHAAIVVYDITEQESFLKSHVWIQRLQQQGLSDLIIALVGNKSDMVDQRQVDTNVAKSYAEENGMIFFETSAKTGENVEELFRKIAIDRLQLDGAFTEPPLPDGIIRVKMPQQESNDNKDGSNKGSCCKN